VPYNGKNLSYGELVKVLAGAINRKVDDQVNEGCIPPAIIPPAIIQSG
jgi:hypothetical protein